MKAELFISLLIMGSILFTGCNSKHASKAGYEGEDISGIAEILRDKTTKKASLKIETDGQWQLFAGRQVETIDFSKPLLEGDGSGKFPLNVPNTERSYFELVTDKGKAILAEKHLPMAGGYNFRDLGGYKTKDGRFVKWGKIFRSDDMPNLTKEDLEYLSSIPIVSVVDFRSEEEVKMAPDKLPSSTIKEYMYSITPGNLTAGNDIAEIASLNMDSVMIAINQLLVTDSAAIQRYVDFFALLQDESKVPLLFHCTAGKDRTGMGAALILYALGVDEDIIMNDYLLSNRYLAEKYGKFIQTYPEMESLFTVHEDFLRAGLDKIKADHGSVDNYLEKVLKINLNQFKEMYLY